MITITLPDGSGREFDEPVSGAALAASIAKSLAKAALAIKVDGEVKDLSSIIDHNCTVEIVTKDHEDALELIRHDCAHVMAEAVQELYPGTQVTIGPAIATGFYYDFARDEPFTPDDLEKIEAKMRQIIAKNEPFTREVWNRDDAIAHFEKIGETYKAELIRDLPETEEISIYRQGNWLDLCRGPHLPSTGKVGNAFKLMSVAGAYWRGDSRNPMLQRIYGTAWTNDKELKAHLHMIEEAEKRDHRRLGPDLDLFHMQDIASGSVFWHDKGWTLYRNLENFIRDRIRQAGYQEVRTPQLLDSSLWKLSGHWGKFRENMFVVPDEIPSTDEEGPIISGKMDKVLALKPMNCPAHIQIFRKGSRSYRDLPLRMAEFGCCHRNEPSGALHGLMRVRQMTQDDGHIFCRRDQISSETLAFCDLLIKTYRDLGFEDVNVKFATRPENRAGADEIWDLAERKLEDALKETGLPYSVEPGEGAFYGPKLEFHLTDAIGRSWQCGTLQLDFVMPGRLEASYIAEDGAKHTPVMIHRALLGSLERFTGILIEHYAGKFPLWMAPVQAVVATITSDADEYAKDVLKKLKDAGIRAEIDTRNEKINFKIREHSVQKVQNILVVGNREADEQTVALRKLGGKNQQLLKLDEAINLMVEESKAPVYS